MTTFEFFAHDFGDSGDFNDVWVAAYVDGNPDKRIGAYVRPDGVVIFDDYFYWRIQSDLVAMGLAPESDEARDLLREWEIAARARGLELFLDGGGDAP